MPFAPIVSVLMPVYRTAPNHFRAAVRSVLAQDFEEWELVIVEDPSDRMATDVINDYPDSRIRYYPNAQRTSLIEQRNRTIELSRGEYLAMLDSDDVSHPQRLSKQLAFLVQHPELGVLGCQLSIIDESGNAIAERRYPLEHEIIASRMRRRNPIPQPGVMLRRTAMELADGYQYDRYIGLEDYDLWCRLLKLGVRFANHPAPLVQYRIHRGQIKQSKLRDQLMGTIDVKCTHFAHELSLGDHLRISLERCLVNLPAVFVVKLFKLLTYVKPIRH